MQLEKPDSASSNRGWGASRYPAETEEVKAVSCSSCLSLPSKDVLPMAETLASCPHCLHFITRDKQS